MHDQMDRGLAHIQKRFALQVMHCDFPGHHAASIPERDDWRQLRLSRTTNPCVPQWSRRYLYCAGDGLRDVTQQRRQSAKGGNNGGSENLPAALLITA
jgi:hypothetical protein